MSGMGYVTIYLRTVKRRKSGRVQRMGCYYRTKSLTAMHAHIRETYPGAQTFKDPERVITDFVPGLNLTTLPIVCGGELIAE